MATSRERASRAGFRATTGVAGRLCLLVGLALTPALALHAYHLLEDHDERVAQVEAEALRLARFAAGELDRAIEGARGVLFGMAQAPPVRAHDAAACTDYAARLAEEFPQVVGFGAIDADGRVFCVEAPAPPDEARRTDSPSFRAAMAGRGLAIGTYTAGHAGGRHLLPLALAYQGEGGKNAGVVVGALDLDRLAGALAAKGLPPGASLTVADREGTALVRLPDRSSVGRPMPAPFRHLLGAEAPGTLIGTGSDGVERIVGYVPPAATAYRAFYVSVGFDRGELLRSVDAATRRALALVVAGLLLSGLAVWWGARRQLARPMARLGAMAQRFAGGDLTVRVGAVRGPREVQELGAAFDRMATSLAASTAAVAESEARLQQALAAGRVFAFDWDPVTDVVRRSANCDVILGLAPGETAAEGTGQGYFAHVHPDDRERFVATVTGASPESPSYTTRYRYGRPDGSVAWLEETATAGFDPCGRFVRLSGLTRDVTAEVAAEAALRRSEERFRLLARSGSEAIWDWDVASNRVFWADNVEEVIGHPPERLDPEPHDDPALAWARWDALIHPEDHERAAAGFARAIRERQPVWREEYRFARPGGGYAWLLEHDHLIFDDAGRLVRVIGSLRDVSDRKRAELDLAEAERQARERLSELEALYATAPVGLAVLGTDLRFLRINERLAEMNGLPVAEHLGRTVRELLPGVADQAEALARRVIETGEPVLGLEIVGETPAQPGARRVWVESWAPIKAPGGAVVALSVAAEEVTGQRAAQEALARSEAELARANEALEARVAERTAALLEATRQLAAEMRRREEAQAALAQAQKLEALGQLTGGVAHDFNNMLAAILASFRLVGQRVADPEARQLLELGQKAAESAAGLVRRLLAFARQQKLEPQPVDLASLLPGMGDLLRQAVGKGVELAIAAEAGLWPALADPQQLEAALVNLAVNARDAMPEGGRLAIAARNLPPSDPERWPELGPGEHVLISVADTGCGMAPEILARATEPFFTTKGHGKGTGLGLSMVHGFVRQSGGAMRIRSRPGAGTTVELALPRSASAAAPAGEPVPAIERGRHGRATLLLVDDDDRVRPLTAAMLRDLGYGVVEAPGGETALALAQAGGAIDLVVTDVVMPGMGGAELAARLRALRPGLPVLFVTGHGRGAELTGEEVLAKPFTVEALAARILKLLGRGGEAAPPAGRAMAAPTLDPIAARLRAPGLRELYDLWRELAGPDGKPPPFERFDPERLGDGAGLFTVAVDRGCAPTGFRFLTVGRGLTAALGRPLDGTAVPGHGEEALGALEGAYRRCCRSGRPSHEYARFDLGDGAPVLFERLLLPFSAEGREVSHLVGMAAFTNLPPREPLGDAR